jgi:hypothetical protein
MTNICLMWQRVLSSISYRWVFVDICFARWVKEDKSLMADLAHYLYIMKHKIVLSLCLVGPLGMANSVATCTSHACCRIVACTCAIKSYPMPSYPHATWIFHSIWIMFQMIIWWPSTLKWYSNGCLTISNN